jgi:hypothetical protein
MDFEGDAFISYAHLDDVALVEGRKGWVANLHRALEVRAAQLLGKTPAIWRDPKLQGNDLFEETLVERLRRVAVLVTVISPRYIRSEWTLRELREFSEAVERQGGFGVQERARVFKVIKTPVPLERIPPELQGLLGYEFFKVDPETGKVRELDEVFGPEAHRDFWLKLDDLAHDLCALLEELESENGGGGRRGDATPVGSPGSVGATSLPMSPRLPGTLPVVYLATTTSDLQDERDALLRDLQEHGYRVLPDRPIPLVAHEAEAMIREHLVHSRMSIHLIGKNYGIVPEGGVQSNMALQHELATERSRTGGFSRLLWIPRELQVEDPRQRRLIDDIRMDPGIHGDTDVMETFFEDLRTVAVDWLKRCVAVEVASPPEPETPTLAPEPGAPPRLYLIAEQRDAERIHAWADPLFEEGFEVQYPIFEGDEGELREYHEENLNSCDAVLIFYGEGNEIWLRRKLREIQKSPGYGRVKPPPVTGISLVGPRSPEKERFRTHEALVIPQWEGYHREALAPFIEKARAARGV